VADRTLACSIPLQGGIRIANVRVQSGVREHGNANAWHALPSAHVSGGAFGVVGVEAGWPMPASPLARPATYWIFTDHCGPSSARVALAPDGLAGGRAGTLREHFRCETPRSVLVRIRAEFRRPVRVPKRGAVWTRVPVRAGALAVRTRAGKPLVSADVFEAGRTRVFLARSCSRA
jgi:hypothetical protein